MTLSSARAQPSAPLRALHRERAAAADRAWIVEMLAVVNAVVIVGMWVRHGGVSTLGTPGGVATGTGQLTGLLGTYVVLLELLLMTRLSWLERAVGLDRLAIWHRWTGFTAVSLLVGHTVLITIGYAQSAHVSLWSQTSDFVRNYADVLMAFVALALLVALAVTSVRAARRRLQRETWYFVHLYAYLAVVLGFAHQLAVGNDFVTDRLARVYWVGLFVAAAVIVIASRVASPLAFNARHRLRVRNVVREAPDVVSIIISGHELDRMSARAGQFFLWRFLTPEGWWKAHPLSLSAAPTKNLLRITVKDLGDTTHRLQRVRPGTRVFAEGPFGTFTARRRSGRALLLIAGGIGITPLRALLDEMPRGTACTLLYRVNADDDIVFARELREIADAKGIEVICLTGFEIGDDQTDRLGIPMLRRLVPDIRNRDCFVCGPPAMIAAVRRRLHALGVPDSSVHFERFEF
ncbi:MAG TPA: ferredoxin reductase family protein [Acidimicrobiia bacterium]|nr:ferredoxin reductase family protein [Acidimicrobiia bacterium]